jgi:hypothetical protein
MRAAAATPLFFSLRQPEGLCARADLITQPPEIALQSATLDAFPA